MDQNKIKELEAQIEQYKKESLQNLEKLVDELLALKTKPTELVRSWEEAYNGKGYYVRNDSDIKEFETKTKHLSHKNVFRTETQVKSALAFAQLSHIVADANGDWVADWGDSQQSRYGTEVISNDLRIVAYSSIRVQLPVKSKEIAVACLEKHRTLWEDFWMISK